MIGYGRLKKETHTISFDEKRDQVEDLARNEKSKDNLVPQKLPVYVYHISVCNIVFEESEI